MPPIRLLTPFPRPATYNACPCSFQRELADNVDCLFVFVEHPEVEPTNNRSERNARREAEIRKGTRISKTDSGAKRRSIIVTVLASLQTRIASFTLSDVLAEVGRWVDTGKSLFELELETVYIRRKINDGPNRSGQY